MSKLQIKVSTIFCTIILTIGLSEKSNAQFQNFDFEHGFHGGITLSELRNLEHEYTSSSEVTLGYSIEAGVPFRPLTIISGIGYKKTSSWRRVQGVRTDFITEYINLPVLIGYYFEDYKVSGAHFFAGTAINYLTNSDIRFNLGEETIIDEFKDSTNDFLFTLKGGLGTKVQVAFANLSFRIQYSISLNDVYVAEDFSGGRMNVLSITGGVYF